MSNFVLYHGLGIRGYEHVRGDDTGGRLVFTIRQRREALRCSHCGSARVFSKGQVPREWRCVPWGHKPVFVRLAVARVLCRDCGLTRQVATFAHTTVGRLVDEDMLAPSTTTVRRNARHHFRVASAKIEPNAAHLPL